MNKPLKTFLLFLIILNVNTTYAKISKIDSLNILIHKEKDTDELAILYLEISWQLKYIDLEKSTSIAKKSLKTLQNSENMDGIGIAYSYLASYEYLNNEIATSIATFEKAEKIFLETNNLNRLARVYNNLGNSYSSLFDFSNSLLYYTKSLDIKEQNAESTSITSNLINISTIHYHLGEYQECIEKNEQALILALQENDFESTAIIYTNLGASYERLGNYTKAVNYDLKALELYQNNVKNNIAEIRAYINLGVTYMSQNMISEARHYFQLAQDFNFVEKSDQQTCIILNNIAELERIDHNYDIAREVAKEALVYEYLINYPEERLISINELYLIEKDVLNYKEALAYYREYIQLSDSLLELTNVSKTNIALAQNQVTLQKVLLANELKHAKLIYGKSLIMKWLMVFAFVLFIVWIIVFITYNAKLQLVSEILNFLITFLLLSVHGIFLFMKTTILTDYGTVVFFLIVLVSIFLGVILHHLLNLIFRNKTVND